ncbi:MAG: fibronectin type III domain-containing protein [Candidatus Marinimicrobia bacterium]|nr:fibronectin type III domain-containing protein [Candidatus Neomarinimicrobiota bacterium]
MINFKLTFTALLVCVSGVMIGCAKDEGDTEPPAVSITAPVDSQTVNGRYTIKCTATDNRSVVAVKVIIDGKMVDALFQSNSMFHYYWNTTDREDSSRHYITAQAFDASDNIGLADTVICYVDNRGIAPVAVLLSAPTNVTKHSMTLSWKQSIDKDFSEYRLYRNQNNVWDGSEKLVVIIRNPYQTVHTDDGSNADTSWVTPWGLDENKTYYYRLQVAETGGLSSYSNVVFAATKLPEPVVLRESYVATKLTATISWYQSSEDVKYYRIHRNRSASVGNSLADSVGAVSAAHSSFVDTGLTSLTNYYYKVFVVDEAGYEAGSNVIRVETGGIGEIRLYEPFGDQVKKHSIQLSWSKSREEDKSEYRLYRSLNSGVSSSDFLVATIDQTDDTVHTDTNLRENTTYYYAVYLVDSEGNTSRSNEISIRTMNLQAIPLSVKSLGKYEVNLGWEAYSENDFDGYYLYRSDHAGFDTSHADLKVSFHDRQTTSYFDNGLNLDSQYYYRFFVADTFGSKTGSELSVHTKSIERVEIKAIEPIDDSYFRLTFTMNREDEDFQYYSIHRSESANVSSSDLQIGTIPNRSDTTFNDPMPAVQNLEYYYRVYVIDSRNNWSTGSNIVGDTLNTPPEPVELSFAGSTTSSIRLRWTLDRNDDFSVYELYRSVEAEFTKSSKNVVKIATISDKNTTSYTESNLPSGVLYYYCVYVVDIGGKSSASNIVQAYTVP